jgi:hypothetical protein
MPPFFTVYLAAWAAACLAALAIYLANRRAFAASCRGYFQFIGVPWKLWTFAIAAAGLVLIAPYTGDPTWDYFDAAFMAVLTYLTAPWAAGVFYRLLRGRGSWKEGYVALCVWLFSASWSYDLYLLLRDGYYPATWLPNVFASSVLYWAAALLWSLEWQSGRGVIFGFMRDDWPAPPQGPQFHRVVWAALPFMLIAGAAIGSFVFLPLVS